MRTKVMLLLLTTTLWGVAAWAQDQMAPRTEAPEAEVTRGLLKQEKVAIRPQAGVLAYTDQTGNTSSRLAAGLTIDWNLMSSFEPGGMSNWYIGPSTGLIYSHLGNADANFFGSNSSVSSGTEGANFFYVPVNLKVGYNVADNFRIAAHGGGNMTYRSKPQAISIGTNTGTTTQAFPNVGADLEWGMGGIALGLRPDWTLGTQNSIFTGSLTVAVPIV